MPATPRGPLRAESRDDSKWATAAPSDLHWHRDHHRNFRGQLIEIRDVLERGYVLPHQDAVTLK